MQSLLKQIAIVFSIIASVNCLAIAVELEQLIISTTQSALSGHYPDDSYTLHMLPLAGVDRLKPCSKMQAQVKGHRLYGRVPVHVRCLAPAAWSLYASVDVDVNTAVVVATQSIARGQRITSNMLAVEMQAIETQRPQALTAIIDVVGMVARRSIRRGQTLNLNQLAEPNQISKGERVQIIANNGRIQIKSFGTALANGKLGDQIEVRNERSKRIILPWITAPGTVSTRPPTLTLHN